jgi:protein SYS1
MQRRRRPPRAGALSDLPPLKIISKIILLQVAYYLCAIILILFTTLVAGKTFSIDLILSWRSIRGDNTLGWTLGVVWLLNSLVG